MCAVQSTFNRSGADNICRECPKVGNVSKSGEIVGLKVF